MLRRDFVKSKRRRKDAGHKRNMMTRLSQPSQNTRIKVIATIPCFNTELSIVDVVSGVKNHVDEVLVVDDGSQDRTAEMARTAGAVMISHGANRGYGEAIKTCFEATKANDADILITIDGDGQHNPEEIPLLLAPILKGEADMVIGSRLLTGGVNMPRYRKFGISVITFLFNLGSRIKVSDAQSGFRAYSRKTFENLSLSESGMSISIEILEKAKRKGDIIKEVPVTCIYPHSGLNLKSIKHGLGVALSVSWLRLNTKQTKPASIQSAQHERKIEEPEQINQRELMEYYGYKGPVGVIKYYFRYLRNWVLQTLAKVSPHPGLAVIFQRARGVKIGKHVFIGPGVNIDDLYPHLVTIEDYISIGMNSMVFAHSNPTCSLEIKQRYYPRKVAPTTIGRGAWIAPGCIILAGVTIGKNSIIGAGSVVTKDVESYTIVAGNPAKLVRRLETITTEQDD